MERERNNKWFISVKAPSSHKLAFENEFYLWTFKVLARFNCNNWDKLISTLTIGERGHLLNLRDGGFWKLCKKLCGGESKKKKEQPIELRRADIIATSVSKELRIRSYVATGGPVWLRHIFDSERSSPSTRLP